MTSYTFTLDGPIVPKARARTTRNGTYHPHRYQRWKKGAIAAFQDQWRGETLTGPVAMSILMTGKHNRRGDLSNAFGAIEDAIVQSGILRDDNMTCITSISAELNHSKKDPTTQIWLELNER